MRNLALSLILILSVFCATALCETETIGIHFIDADEGESTLIRTPNGSSVLIDAGNLATGFMVIKHLEDNNIDTLEHLIFTHPDADHMGGAFFLMQMIEVARVYDNDEKLDDSDMYRWYKNLVRANENYGTLKEGDAFTLDGVSLKVLWPPKPQTLPLNWNNNSLVIMVEFGKFRCLMMGDVGAPVEEKLLERKIDLKADVLKVGHHGYDDASSEGFLSAVSPSISVIHAKTGSKYGRPSEEVLQRLRDAGTKTYRTDKHGTVVISADREGNIYRGIVESAPQDE